MAATGRCRPSTTSSRGSPSARGTAARSSRAASSRCSPSAARCMTNPLLLIMDEPSEGLAPAIVENLIGVFRSLEESGLAIILIEQNLVRRDHRRAPPARDGRRAHLHGDDGRGARQRSRGAAPLPRRRAVDPDRVPDGDRRPARHARHEGARVRVPARSRARARRRRAAARRGHPRRAARRSRTSVATRSPRRPARASPRWSRGNDRGAAIDGDGARRRRRCVARLHAEGKVDGDPRARRLGQLDDHRPGHAGAAGRRARSCSSRPSPRATRGPTSARSTSR